MSTVSMLVTVAVIEALLSIIPYEMGKGNIVRLGAFGSFWVKVKTVGVETPESVTSSNNAGVVPRFTPGKEFKDQLKTYSFEKK